MRRFLLAGLASLCTITLAGQQPSPSHADEAAVIEQIRQKVVFDSDGTGRRETYMRTKVQSEAGVQQLGEVTLGYNAATERLEIPFIRVRKPDGTVIETPAQSVRELTPPFQRIAPVYTDFRQKQISVKALRPGDTLEVSVIATIHTPLAPGQFWAELGFDDADIVLDEQLELDVPADKRMLLKLAPGLDATFKEAGGRRVYHWTHSHAVREDEKTRTENEKKRAWDEPERAPVRLTTFADWKEVGQWFGALEQTARQPSAEVRDKARQLTEGRTTDLDKIEALYDFVSKNFRYVSLSLGAGRYQPRPAVDVLQDAYGDCKDKHTLLASLIAAAGLRASAVLINSSAKIDPDFPSPSQFDHVITRAVASGQEVWMDATPEVAPFRLLSFPLRGKQALLAEARDGSRLVETPGDTPMPGMNRTELDGVVDEAGTFTGTAKFTARGDVELLMRTVFRGTPAAQWPGAAERIANDAGFAGGKVTDLNVSDPQATREPFTLSFRVRAPGFVNWSNRRMDVPLPMTSGALPRAAESGAIVLGGAGTTEYRLSLGFPGAAKLRAPAGVTVSRDYGEYHATYGVRDATFTAERVLTIRQRDIPQVRRADYEAFARVISSDSAQRLGVDASALSAPAGAPAAPVEEAKALNRSGYNALQAGDFAKAITDLKRVVELEPKDPVAWNNLGRAYMGLRKTDLAIAAYLKQIEVNPYDAYAHNNLGNAYVAQRKFELAEAAYKRQIEINPLDRYASAGLGRMYVLRRQFEPAAATLEKAVEITPDQSALYVQLGKAYVNLHRNDAAATAFAKAVELSPTPLTWNDVAYELALGATDLDRAQRYAESAVSAQSAASRNIDVEHVDARSLAVVSSLGSYWDTLGWVAFARNDLPKAERYVAAAWKLGQHAEVGDHLGQIYEKTGRHKLAIQLYAQAAATLDAAPEVREHLGAVAGGAANVEKEIAAHREELAQVRTIPIAGRGPAGKKGEFFILFGPPGVVEAVSFIEGDAAVKDLGVELQKIKIDGMFPDDMPAKLLRRGIVACSGTGSCALTLLLPQDARPAR